MNVLWFSWKDRRHPQAGGAETVSGELMDRLVRDGHQVKLITAQYPGSSEREVVNGIEIFRGGNRYTVYQKARSLYKNQLSSWPDIVIDEMNTIPFFTPSYTDAKHVLLCYQLAREIWFHQMVFPFSVVGYASEPLMLRHLSRRYDTVATESNSTKNDLAKYGFTNTHVFRVGIDLPRKEKLPAKKNQKLILSLGAVRPMKRTLDAIKAFEVARDANLELTMIIAGDTIGAYSQRVINYTQQSRHAQAITVMGRISKSERLHLMEESTLILVTSVKEGWGLIVTEANSQGTPAIAYNTDGLRDSVRDQETGILCKDGDYTQMGHEIVSLLSNGQKYAQFRTAAWEWSEQFTFANSYADFLKIISE